jgi:hypothetical protein
MKPVLPERKNFGVFVGIGEFSYTIHVFWIPQNFI